MYQGIIIYEGSRLTAACISRHSRVHFEKYLSDGDIAGYKIVSSVWLDEPFANIEKSTVMEAAKNNKENGLVAILEKCEKFSNPI